MLVLLYIKRLSVVLAMVVLSFSSSSCTLQLYYCGGGAVSAVVVASTRGDVPVALCASSEKRTCPKECCQKKRVLVEGLDYTAMAVVKTSAPIEYVWDTMTSYIVQFSPDCFVVSGLHETLIYIPPLTKDRVVAFEQFLI